MRQSTDDDDSGEIALYARDAFREGVSVTVSTVMSSNCPNCFAASAMALADWVLMAWVRWKPKSSRRSLVASTTPSDTKVRRSFGSSWNVVSEEETSGVLP